jgi:hypothetical protein
MEALLHERYQLTLRLPIQVDLNNRKVTSFRNPEFIFEEFERISFGTDGQCQAFFKRGSQRRFGTNEWSQLVRSGGDLSIFGATETNPIPGVAEYWRIEHRR